MNIDTQLQATLNSLLESEKVKKWGQNKGQEVISLKGDIITCPMVEYLMSTGVFELVDITTYETVWFWTVEEIAPLTDEEIQELDDKHCLDLPPWVGKAIKLFDEILKSRAVIGHDVVRVVGEVI